MISSFRALEYRSLALLSAAAIGAFAVVFIVLEFQRWDNQLSDKIGRSSAAISQFKKLVEGGPNGLDQAFEKAVEASRKDYLSGASQAIGLADLQSRLTGHAKSLSCTTASIRNLPPIIRHDVTLVGLRFSVTCGFAMAQRFVHTVEDQDPILIIDRIALSRDVSGSSTSGGRSDGSAMRLELDVFGAIWPLDAKSDEERQ